MKDWWNGCRIPTYYEKNMIHGQERLHMENIKEHRPMKLFEVSGDYKSRMRRLSMNFNGDQMAAHTEHVTNSTMVSFLPSAYRLLKPDSTQLECSKTMIKNDLIARNEPTNSKVASTQRGILTALSMLF